VPATDPPAPRTRRAEWALAAASALAVLLAAGLAEAVLRGLRPEFLRGTRALHPHVYSETYGWALRPGARYVGRGGETISVNARGYRGPLHADAPPAGVTRVLMLGDSVTFGSGVSDAETFTSLLDARPDLEALNFGVDGYGTDQALLRLQREGLAFRPHVVVLNFCVRNDHFDNALAVALYDGRSPKPYYTLDGGRLVLHETHLKLTRRQRAAVALVEGSFLVNALLAAFGAGPQAVGGGRDEEDWGERRRVVLEDFDRTAALTVRLIRAAREEAENAGARFVVVVHPDRRAWSGDDALVRPLTSGLADRTQLVLLQGEYAARRLSFEEITLDRLGHLSRAGHHAAAGIIGRFLEGVSTDRRP
jgi:hypothetical protein